MPPDSADPWGASRPSLSARDLTILAPTRLEHLAARAVLRGCPVVHSGIGLTQWSPGTGLGAVIVCGLAGGLAPSLLPGAVVIPTVVATIDGRERRCDPDLVDALREGARALGFAPVGGPMLTAPRMVTGAERAVWAARGFVAADMEAALLPPGVALAAVRVVLDTPSRSISDRWTSPGSALVRPALLGELVWLSWAGPRYALRAARVLRAGLARSV